MQRANSEQTGGRGEKFHEVQIPCAEKWKKKKKGVTTDKILVTVSTHPACQTPVGKIYSLMA